ncbi:hypothetical protein CY34DRAFT_805970 [Suillus luteus UH-Slu-Lm8-n1]|uniref:Mid2 domain-containing protein n=1 Tax=Suillus luteus UH-Slu-Lm8-n1 TaxID=930992 RepID=A0A0D0BE01_9AGAM|nr:hypothetical protein CY34DRAFT_805970 [Suillus luteus UH-Slu-Lm8-n1]
MSHSLPALAFVLALQSFEVAGSAVYLREPVFMSPRDDGDGDDDGDGPSTTSHSTTSTTTSSTTSSSTTSTSTSQSNSSSSSTTTTTSGTLNSSSSSPTNSSSSSQNNESSTTSQGLSTGARTGLAFGIMFLVIFGAMLVCYVRKRSRRARESVSYEPALMSSEVSQYRPPDAVALRERNLPPPPPPPLRLDTTYPNSPENSHPSSLSAISSAAPLLSDVSHPNSQSTSAWNRHSGLSQASDLQQIAMQDAHILPNPYDPFAAAPIRSASYASSASSPAHSIPHSALIPASAAVIGTFATTVAGSSSNIQPERRPSTLHTDMTRHQKELELDHRKQSIDAQEVQDPPPQYFS